MHTKFLKKYFQDYKQASWKRFTHGYVDWLWTKGGPWCFMTRAHWSAFQLNVIHTQLLILTNTSKSLWNIHKPVAMVGFQFPSVPKKK